MNPRWLREAERIQIWRRVGCSTLLEYMEKRLGYGPRAAQERLRVAFALDALPALAESLETGALPFTAVRELTRVATPETEQVWLDAGRDKNVHEIEKLVAGHRPGDLPTDQPDPEIVMKVLRYEVRPATYALIRQAQRALEKQRGERLDDDAFLAALAGIVLGGGAANSKAIASADTRGDAPSSDLDNDDPNGATSHDRSAMTIDSSTYEIAPRDGAELATAPMMATSDAHLDVGRARFQIAVVTCEGCRRGWIDAGGKTVPMDAADLERARCDAQHLGSLEAATPARAKQDVPPSVRRLVHRRDRGRCSLPDCRAAANLEVHHIVAREDGGSHEAKNIVLLCDGHHASLHRGLISISGEAPDRLIVEKRHRLAAHIGVNRLDRVTIRVQARSALVKLGFKPGEATAAIEMAAAEIGGDVGFDTLLRTALRHCPKSSS